MKQDDSDQRPANTGVKRTVTRTVAALVGMFAFAFALVPLYDVFCEVTGLNGKVNISAQAFSNEAIDESRMITVQFITRGSSGLPWRMEVETRQVRVYPGQSNEVNFTFHNQGDVSNWGRAVPSVSPSVASKHLRKINCFCFEEQELQAGESLELPLVFQLTRDLPPEVNTVTLVYTLYPVTHNNEPLQAKVTDGKGDEA